MSFPSKSKIVTSAIISEKPNEQISGKNLRSVETEPTTFSPMWKKTKAVVLFLPTS